MFVSVLLSTPSYPRYIASSFCVCKKIATKVLKITVASKYIIYMLTFVSPGFTIYEPGTSCDWDGDTKVYLLFCLLIKTLFLVGYTAMLNQG